MTASMRQRDGAPANRRPGFTLVEMLVVISIIIILASIVVPVTMRIGAQSRVVACKNNMLQIHKALFAYSQSWGQRFPGQWRGDDLRAGGALLVPFQLLPPIEDYDNVRGDDDLSPLFAGGYAQDIRVFNCPSTADRADPERKDESDNELPKGYDIMYKASQPRYTNAAEFTAQAGTGPRGELSYEYPGEIAPGIHKGKVKTQLAWLLHDIDDRDLDAGKKDWEVDGDNHGTSGGNMLFVDGRVVWVLARDWTHTIRAGHEERLTLITISPLEAAIPADAELGEWDRALGWPNPALDLDRLRTRKLREP